MQNAFSPLCTVWQEQVKELFPNLHGHQSKTLALFVWGAIQGKSMVVQRVAEELLAECPVKCESLERRLRRFLCNDRVEVKETWDHVLASVLPYWEGKEVKLVLDLTPFDDHATVVYLGLLQQMRVLPLAWKVMPSQDPWEEKLWAIVEELFAQVASSFHPRSCTVMADRGLGHLPLIQLCQAYGWHDLLRICKDEWVRRWQRGHWDDWKTLSQIVEKPGQHWSGTIQLWQEHEWPTQLSAVWEEGHQEAWFLISDQQAGSKRIAEYRWRMRVESTFEDMKSRGWQLEATSVRQRERLDRLLLVLFLAFWWLMHLAASCIHNGRRDRYDRHDRRDKGHLRLGRLYLLDIARKTPDPNLLRECLLFRRRGALFLFSLRF
jgi:Transposase DDE domain